MMKLVGSRNLGIHFENSDYDYVVIDDRDGGWKDVVNERIDKNHHCYHYPKNYREQIAHFNVEHKDDFIWIYNAEDYKSGIIDVNPFDYKDKWIDMLKSMEFYHRSWFVPNLQIVRKRVYHIVYNLECLKCNSLELDEKALSIVKEWHDGGKTLEDYENLINEINSLTK